MTRYGLLVDESIEYPGRKGLYRPSAYYPEYPFPEHATSNETNNVYDGVRRLFSISGLDSEHFGRPEWNPLGGYVSPGDRVLVKPNLVMDVNASGCGTDCLYTHPSVIAAVIDYVVIALKGRGSITLGDAPVQSCDFNKLTEQSGLLELVSWYRGMGVDIDLVDMRGLRSVEGPAGLRQELLPGKGRVIDLGESSEFFGLSGERIERLRITNYDPRELKKHHSKGKHEYFISSYLLDSDVVINLPKAKTHRKAGVTGALKNMVGVNVRKEYLPHHTLGPQSKGFDEYGRASAMRALGGRLLDARNSLLGTNSTYARTVLGLGAAAASKFGRLLTGDQVSEGSWAGNDTIWRTVLDINKIVRYADRTGTMQDLSQRRMIHITDFVVIGQGEGPLEPVPGNWGMLSFSDSAVASDVAMAQLLGADVRFIPCIGKALAYEGDYRVADGGEMSVVCWSNNPLFDGKPIGELNEGQTHIALPSRGWERAFASHR